MKGLFSGIRRKIEVDLRETNTLNSLCNSFGDRAKSSLPFFLY